MKAVENYVACAEQLLNPFDWVPYISSISGMVRILAGAVQVAATLVFAAIRVIQALLTPRGSVRRNLELPAKYMAHAFTNIGRGALAIHPWWNLLLAFHDWKLGRFNYPDETMRPGVYPLATAYKLAQI
jgi:hypothetical protein